MPHDVWGSHNVLQDLEFRERHHEPAQVRSVAGMATLGAARGTGRHEDAGPGVATTIRDVGLVGRICMVGITDRF